MRTQNIVATAILSLMAATRAEAAPIYTTTDLGASYQLQAGAGGQVYGVAGADGTVYAFDKSPVTSISLQTDNRDGSIQFLTLQNGAHQVVYISGYAYPTGPFLYPTFEGSTFGWFTTLGSNRSPVTDINSQGQIVGISDLSSPGQSATYAAFSDPNGQNHGGSAPVTDNLNNYIATIPGVSLTSAVNGENRCQFICGENWCQFICGENRCQFICGGKSGRENRCQFIWPEEGKSVSIHFARGGKIGVNSFGPGGKIGVNSFGPDLNLPRPVSLRRENRCQFI